MLAVSIRDPSLPASQVVMKGERCLRDALTAGPADRDGESCSARRAEQDSPSYGLRATAP